MGSLTSRKAHAPEPAQGQQDDWPVFVCRQGAFLFDPRAYFPVDPEEAKVTYSTVEAAPERGYVVLPACRDKDQLLDQPALGLRLSQAEAEKLIQDTGVSAGVLAATDIGPTLDKASNQDFALAATIKLPHGDAVYQFAAVADGVTSRTLWPERSARLAAFAAWRAARRHLELGRGFSHDDFEKFRQSLVDTIRAALERDMAILSAPEYAKVVPAGWAPDTYEQFRSRRDLWYNSTLLVALVGAEAGFVATCGDGGLVVRKRVRDESKSTVLVHSTDDLSVTGVVSLSPDALQFRQTRIALPNDSSIEVVMSTDGVDRSLRRAFGPDKTDQDPYGPEFSTISSACGLNALILNQLDQIEGREIDNLSIAVLQWPCPRLPAATAPRYQGAVAATGQTVDDINRKLDRIYRDGDDRLRSAAVEAPPPVSTDWQAPPIARGSTPPGLAKMPPAYNLPPPAMARASPDNNPGIASGGHPAAQTSSRSSLGIAVDRSMELADVFCQGSPPVRDLLLERLTEDHHTRHHFVSSNRLLANLSKLAFFVLAATFNKPSLQDRYVETVVDRMILAKCRFLPTLAQREINYSVSNAFVMLLRELTHSEPLLKIRFHRATNAIKSL